MLPFTTPWPTPTLNGFMTKLAAASKTTTVPPKPPRGPAFINKPAPAASPHKPRKERAKCVKCRNGWSLQPGERCAKCGRQVDPAASLTNHERNV